MEHTESDGHVGSFVAKLMLMSSIQAPNFIKWTPELGTTNLSVITTFMLRLRECANELWDVQ